MMESISHWIIDQFQTNAVFTGLTSVSLIGSATYLLRSAPKKMLELFSSQFVTYMYVTNDDYAFDCINTWLSKLEFASHSRKLNLTIKNNENDREWTLAPGAGRHFFTLSKRLFWVDRTINEQATNRTLKRQETIRISTFGRNQRVFRLIIQEAEIANNKVNGIAIYGWRGGWWNSYGHRQKRSLDTVVLPGNQKTRVLDDLSRFFDSQPWYINRGIPYHRGYLFSGPPGTGKTSFIFSLASHFDRPIYLLNLSTVVSDEALLEAFSSAPIDALILIEDIDACQTSQTRQIAENKNAATGIANQVTLSGLLNVIDGVATAEGRVYFMTSNYPEKLDSALLRPGRVDLHEILTAVGQEEAKLLFVRFYPEHVHLADRFANTLVECLTPAELQNLFMRYPEDPAKLILNLHKFAA